MGGKNRPFPFAWYTVSSTVSGTAANQSFAAADNSITGGSAVFALDSVKIMGFSVASTAPSEISTNDYKKLLPAINAATANGDQVTTGSYAQIVTNPKWTSWVTAAGVAEEDTTAEGTYGAFALVTYKITISAPSSVGMGDYVVSLNKGEDYDTTGVGSNLIILAEQFGSEDDANHAGADSFTAVTLGTTKISLGDESAKTGNGVYYFRVLVWLNGKTVADGNKTALAASNEILVATAEYARDGAGA